SLLYDDQIRQLRRIHLEFSGLVRAHRREFAVVLVTARPLTPALLEFRKATIAADYLTPGDSMVFSHQVPNPNPTPDPQVDPSLKYPGYRVVINGVEVDHTWERDQRRHLEEDAERAQ